MTNTTPTSVLPSPFAGYTPCGNLGCNHRANPTTGFCTPCQGKVRYALHRTSDGVATGRTQKMSPEQIAEARQRISRFEKPEKVAKAYGVSLTTLRRSLKR